MAKTETHPVPKVRKAFGVWRVTWCEVDNRLWYREFSEWRRALAFANGEEYRYL